MNMQIESYAKTTQENSAKRIQEVERYIGYMGGIVAPGARAIAMLIITLEARITALEERLAGLEGKQK